VAMVSITGLLSLASGTLIYKGYKSKKISEEEHKIKFLEEENKRYDRMINK
jgi:hypothetical protein